MIRQWNETTASADDFLSSPLGMQRLAASCMLIESIGEGVKKIDRIAPGFLESNASDVPWRNLAGLRDHIAHGYFNIDAEIVFDVVVNEIPGLQLTFDRLQTLC